MFEIQALAVYIYHVCYARISRISSFFEWQVSTSQKLCPTFKKFSNHGIMCFFHFIHQHTVSDTQSKFISTNVSKNVVRVFPNGVEKGVWATVQKILPTFYFMSSIYTLHTLFFLQLPCCTLNEKCIFCMKALKAFKNWFIACLPCYVDIKGDFCFISWPVLLYYGAWQYLKQA